jgi:Type IIA topoisomerase (DNA gyrase/topo II, topoisomerase IV), B subunit
MENNSPNNTNAVFTNKLQKSNVFVTKIEKIKLEEPVAVYDVTVNGTHNFLLENGTVVHNTHVQGLFDAITKEFKAVAGRGVDFTASDLREGLIAVIHYKCNDDDYAGQNKEKLNSPSATKIVRDEVSKALAKWVKSNTKLVREISLRATNIKAAKEEARKLTRAASNLKTHNKSVLVPNGKLIMSDKNCPPEKRELFIVEGDSAGGSLSDTRDPSYQEVLKLRGKAINVAKSSSIAKDLANQEIQNLLIALGADPTKIKKGGKIDSFRVGKIILLTDEDIDGEHIKVLLFTILHKYAPEAFKQGIVYIAKLPLFQASNPKTGEKIFGNTLKEVQDEGAASWHISRLKGLGEMDSEELAPFALYEDTRKLVRIEYFKSDKEEKEYLQLVGNDVQYRKKMLGVA